MNVVVISNQISTDNARIFNPVVRNTNIALKRNNVNVSVIPVDMAKYGYLAYVVLFLGLIRVRFFSKEQPEVVHVHFGGFQSLVVNIFFRDNVVVSFHGTDLHGGSPSRLLSLVKSKLNVIASRMSAIISAKCTVVSPSLLEYIPNSALVKTCVISTGVDFSVFSREDMSRAGCRVKLGLDNARRYILFSDISGSGVKRRDIAESVIGDLQNRGLNVELLVLSGVSYKLVPYYVGSSDIVLIVSDKEGSPNIVKEALAMGVPIASVDVGDVFEYISHEPSCIKLKDNNPKFISNSLYRFLTGEEGVIDIGNWKSIISIDNIAKQYLKLYKELARR